MATVAELIQQRDALEAQIAQARQAERDQALASVRAIIEQHGLTAEDVFGAGRGGRRGRGAVSKGAAKYRDPASGKTWSGRGRVPAWLRGKSREEFAIR